jgi:hypothetical protein
MCVIGHGRERLKRPTLRLPRKKQFQRKLANWFCMLKRCDQLLTGIERLALAFAAGSAQARAQPNPRFFFRSPSPEGARDINDLCSIKTHHQHCVAFAPGMILAPCLERSDGRGLRHGQSHQAGMATRQHVARAFHGLARHPEGSTTI